MKIKSLRRATTTVLIFLILLLACVPQSKYDEVKKENEELKKELDEIKYGAQRLMEKAKTMQQEKDFKGAKAQLEELLERHKGSPQEAEARQLIDQLDQQISHQEKQEKQQEQAAQLAEQQRLANATSKLKTSYDDIKGITWYYDKSTPRYNNSNSFHLYMGKQATGAPWLRLKITYTADDWLFIQSYIIKTDKQTYEVNTNYGDVETHIDDGAIEEWYDVSLNEHDYNMIKDIISSSSSKLRYVGKQYYKDRSITGSEKQALKNILNAYEALGGDLTFD